MTILPPYEAPYKPVPQVTPFTYRDGITMLKKLELLQRYINRDLVPFVNDNMEELGDAFETQVNALIEAVNAAIDMVLEGSVEVQDPIIAQLIGDLESQTYAALVAWGNARYVEPGDFNGLGDPRYPVYRRWNGSAYPARIAGASNLFIGPTDPGVLDPADFWLNPNFTTIAAVTTMGDGRWPVYRVWNGSAYPARIAGAVNIFFGPTDPGLAMGAGDYWANPNVTTLAAVNAAAIDTSSLTFAALMTATTGNKITIPLYARTGETVPYQSVGIAGSGLYGWQLDATSDEGLSGDVQIPYGWNVARVRVFFVFSAAGSGDIRFGRSAVTYRDAASVNPIAETFHTIVAPAINIVKSFQHTGDIDLTAYDHVNVNIRRVGSSASDTLPVPIYILGARLEKVS